MVYLHAQHHPFHTQLIRQVQQVRHIKHVVPTGLLLKLYTADYIRNVGLCIGEYCRAITGATMLLYLNEYWWAHLYKEAASVYVPTYCIPRSLVVWQRCFKLILLSGAPVLLNTLYTKPS